jgi:DNA-binding transcriptional LysR family regulator
MNIKQLETFYWIERLGSFSAAAERVFATQSTVSMRIQELEQSLGVKLFDRSHRTARLTPKGKELVPYVQQLIELTAEMQRRITPPESMSGLIRVGVVEIIASTWLPRFIRTLQETYPNILLELEVALSFELTEKLRNGSLDVVFALGRPPGTNYVTESLGSVQLEWMASPALGIPEDTVAPRDLQPWPFITLNRQSYHHARIQTWMKENKVRCRRIIVCNSMTVAATLVMAGIGVSLLPPRCYHREVEAGALRIVRTTGAMPSVEFFAMYPLDEFQPLAQLVTALAARVSDFDRAGQQFNGATATPQSPSPPAPLGKKRSRKTPILGGSPS